MRPLFDKIKRKQPSNGTSAYEGYGRSGFIGLSARPEGHKTTGSNSFQKMHNSPQVETRIIGDRSWNIDTDTDSIPLNAISVKTTTDWKERVKVPENMYKGSAK